MLSSADPNVELCCRRSLDSLPMTCLKVLSLYCGALCWGCVALLDPIDVEGESGSGSSTLMPSSRVPDIAPGADAPLVEAAVDGCDLGEFRCNGAWLQQCAIDPNGSEPQWSLVDDCLTDAQCSTNDESCKRDPCRAGEWQCSEGVYQLCLSPEEGWRGAERCRSQAACQEGLNPCRSDGCTGASAPQCPAAACAPGEFTCFGSRLQRCSSTLEWTESSNCRNAVLCNLEKDTGLCAEPVCEQGEYRCEDNNLLRCNDTLSGYLSEPCLGASVCSVEPGEEPACVAPSCVANQYVCDGLRLLLCNSAGNDFSLEDTCDSAQLCNVEQQRCDVAP